VEPNTASSEGMEAEDGERLATMSAPVPDEYENIFHAQPLRFSLLCCCLRHQSGAASDASWCPWSCRP